jgi:hypothetical protein
MKSTVFFLFLLMSCLASKAQTDCRRQAAYIKNIGYDATRCALSTSEKKYTGVILLQLNDPQNPAAGNQRIYQHPTWTAAGRLGPITTDAFGNAYTTPIASVNVLQNPTNTQNTIYKIDANTGEMALLKTLPPADVSFQNPFGAVGLGYDCDNHLLYVSSIAGSTRTHELGTIYGIALSDHNNIITKLDSTDAMGLAICTTSGAKRLYFGKTRTSDIFSIAVDAQGKFTGAPKFEFSLEGQGTRGDDKARRIKALPNGDLQVLGIEFYYNLTAPTDKPETAYTYRFSPSKGLWLRVN